MVTTRVPCFVTYRVTYKDWGAYFRKLFVQFCPEMGFCYTIRSDKSIWEIKPQMNKN